MKRTDTATPDAIISATTGPTSPPVNTTAIEQQDASPQPLTRVPSGPPYSIFSPQTKVFILVTVSASSLISPFGATTFYPALDVLSAELNVTPSQINLSLTTYMVAQAIAPALIAGMSDASGRRLSYIICFVIFGAANIGLALQTSYAALLVLRMVQAFGCSAAIALSAAVVADLATSAERGKYMGYATAGLLMGPAFGPTIGGVLAEFLSWRSIFWFLAIYAGCLLVVFTIFFPETCRNVVGNGSIPARGVSQSVLGYLQQRRYRRETGDDDASSGLERSRRTKPSFPNPLRTLRIVVEKESSLLLIYNGLFFTGMMVVTASLPTLYKEVYDLSTLAIGLCYISLGIGSLLSALTMGHLVDWNFRRHASRLGLAVSTKKQQDLALFPIERIRLEVVVPSHIIGTLALLAWGWTIRFRAHLAGPEVALFFIGFGVSSSFNLTNTLLIDLHRDEPATATAAVNFVRCLLSAVGAAAIIPMCNAMNPGWAFTLIALLYVALTGVIFVLMSRGQRWRAEKAAREQKVEQQRKESPTNRDVEDVGQDNGGSVEEKDEEETAGK